MNKSINIKALISGFLTFGVLTLMAFLLETSLFYSHTFHVAFGIHLAATFVRYSVSTLVALIEITTKLILQAMVLCIVNLLFWSVLIITIAPNQYKEKAAIIGVDLIVGLAACFAVAAYKTKDIKILPNKGVNPTGE